MPSDPRIVRTLAFVPAHDEDVVLRAADVGLDALGLDLEDSTPGPGKGRAREIFRTMATEIAARGVLVMARTNGFAGGACEADLDAVMCPELHALNIPKAESAEDVLRFCTLLEKAEAAHGIAVGSVLVRPVIETARGVRAAFEIASASPRVTYMGGVAGGFWGDLGATVGLIMSELGTESLYLRSKVVIDVRAAGVRFPVGGGSVATDNPALVRRFAVENKHLGYTGSFVPPRRDVVEIVNDVFSPTSEELAEWAAVLPVLDAARAEGTVVVTIDGRMYDTAGIARVRDQLALAARLGLV
ncbi:MAG TPA: aldolase/citrate lyase family protein [Acidimicrobiales bacterium]|nr:aldolase/citrate lyase family protein [Acidimicrobiales bacterium]